MKKEKKKYPALTLLPNTLISSEELIEFFRDEKIVDGESAPINIKKYAELRKEANRQNYIYKKVKKITCNLTQIISKAACEVIETYPFKNESGLYKSLLITNIIFNDDLELVQNLVTNGFTYEALKSAAYFLLNIKNCVKSNEVVDFKEYLKGAVILMDLFVFCEAQYGKIAQNIVANKITELVVTKKHLIEGIQNGLDSKKTR